MKIELLTEINDLETIRGKWVMLAGYDFCDVFFRTAAWALTRPGFQKFLKEICLNPTNDVQCKLYILRHNEDAVGALHAFYFCDSALYYQAGWEPDSQLHVSVQGVF